MELILCRNAGAHFGIEYSIMVRHVVAVYQVFFWSVEQFAAARGRSLSTVSSFLCTIGCALTECGSPVFSIASIFHEQKDVF